MSHCPHCFGRPLKKYDSVWMYNNGAYDIDEETKIECSECGEKIIMRPFESIDYDFEKIEEHDELSESKREGE
jgi:DNA-directed RNA polymerase subunit RPC12/RpoP